LLKGKIALHLTSGLALALADRRPEDSDYTVDVLTRFL